MCIQIRGSGSGFLFDADADADPVPTITLMHPDPSFQIKAQTLEIVLNRLIFHTFWLVIYKLMRIRFWIQLIT
jgi:hypothetical protein